MSKPVPSVSSLSTYTDTPVSLSTGIPNISIPLLALSGNGGPNLGLQLSYNPMNASGEEAGSEVGTGWLLFKGGVISRQVIGNVDEVFRSTTNLNYQKNTFDDEYYYNLPGLTGKFKIDRNVEQNTFRIIDLTPLNHVKIEYTNENNDATLLVTSFTITDDDGTKYYFNDFSSSVLYDGYYDSIGAWGMEYKSAFFLTQIKDANDVEIASFTYRKDTKYDGTMLLYKTCKLEKMISASGNIEITYDYDQTLEKTMNDPYSIKKVSLNNSYAKVTEYAFEYSYPQMTYSEGTEKRRQLERIKKMDGQNVLEQTSFVYNPNSSNPPEFYACEVSGDYAPSNVLRKIIFPTKGVTEYVYEMSDVFADKNSQLVLDHMLTSYNPCMNFTQTYPAFGSYINQQTSYTFTVSGDPAKKKAFWLNFTALHDIPIGPIDPDTGFPTIPPPLEPDQMMNYTLSRGSEIVAVSQQGEYTQFINYPGQYTVTVNVPYVGGDVNFQMTELMPKPGPYRNAASADGKYRIKSIKRYNDISSSTAEKSISYSYESFSLNNSSSGYLSLGKDLLFKNVKVTEGIGNGYTQYYFKTPDDYPYYSYVKDGNTTLFWPYYNLTKGGLLEKIEVYNQNNQLLSRDRNEYTFAIADDTDYALESGGYSRTAWINYSKTTSEVYPSGSSNSLLQSVSENTARADNFKPAYSKSISPDGTVTEKLYKYAQDKNLTSLLTANMTGIQVESEIKKDGKTIGKSEIKFENTSNRYPSSSIEINANDGSVKTSVRYDLYDEKGNIVQYTTDIDPLTGKGNAFTVIWGYNKTMPIAKITGAKWSDVDTLADDIVAKSNADTNAAAEKELLTALDAFRDNPSLKKFQITTHTYDPLIGVTSVTPPTGIREFYKYDSSGRLISVINSDGNIVKETKYNNKQ
ncbi:hypothetical protein PFY12_12880 [Chryseobacterium camelliae]|uniref:YD repeat-containing protein n=1 Tax=Chryseobacterium camelliae TaxID=1265445 RepID=A0ABY7QJU9_9FLAO|nr:hypothetical protein [Chryseobacterium camelliae]WBV59929.1 hypothetical protein PFY12_12880 [Chryseobacterium camelliae]